MAGLDDYVSLAEGARRVNLSRARLATLLRAGAVRGVRVSDVWLVEVASLEERAELMRAGALPRGGRPKSGASDK